MDWRRESRPHFTEAAGECLEGIEAAGSSTLSLGEYFRIQRLRDQGSFEGDVETAARLEDSKTRGEKCPALLPTKPATTSPSFASDPSFSSHVTCPSLALLFLL